MSVGWTGEIHPNQLGDIRYRALIHCLASILGIPPQTVSFVLREYGILSWEDFSRCLENAARHLDDGKTH